MKRSIKSLILLMVLAVFAGGYFLIDALTNRQANVQESAGSYPLLGEGANIAALSWERDGATIALRKNGDAWQVEGDAEYPLDQEAVKALVSSLAALAGTLSLEGVDGHEY